MRSRYARSVPALRCWKNWKGKASPWQSCASASTIRPHRKTFMPLGCRPPPPASSRLAWKPCCNCCAITGISAKALPAARCWKCSSACPRAIPWPANTVARCSTTCIDRPLLIDRPRLLARSGSEAQCYYLFLSPSPRFAGAFLFFLLPGSLLSASSWIT